MAQRLSPNWEFVADSVMGGVSDGTLTTQTHNGRKAARLCGEVSTKNNGGFLQMAFDLNEGGGDYDASRWSGITLDVLGNTEMYEMRLRTSALNKPWQSFRVAFLASDDWKTVQLPFTAFKAHTHDLDFDPAHLRRAGVLAFGRDFYADVSVAQVQFYT